MRMKKNILVGLILVVLIGIGWWFSYQPLSVQDPYKALKTEKGLHLNAGFPRKLLTQVPLLKVKGDSSLRLQYNSLRIHSYLDNGYARTRYELVVTNPHSKSLEAEFELLLNQGQTFTAFSMEVNGEMRPAVAVEKKKARIAYEATVRKGIDPGLIEQVAGNAFHLRIFPLLTNVPKRLIFEVSSVLVQDAEQAYFALPLKSRDIFGQFSFKAFGYKAGKRVVLSAYHFYKKALDLTIHIKLPLAQDICARANQLDGAIYFSTNMPLPLKYAPKRAPRSLTVCWDASASRDNSLARKKEIKLLLAYLQRIHTGRLEFISFAHEVLDKKYFDIQNGKVKGLQSYINGLAYDGGSSQSCLQFGRMKGEEVLLFTDGLQTLGTFHYNAGKVKIYPIVNSDKADKGLLQDLANQTNGKVIDLQQIKPEQGLLQLTRQYLRFLGFKEQLSGLSYYSTNLDPRSQRIMLSIRAPYSCKKLTALFGLDAQNVLAQKELDISKLASNFAVGRSEVRRWALAKLAHLETQPQKNHEAILVLGIRYRLASSATSLLVLDALEDYLEHRIVPPPSLQKSYYKALAQEKKQHNLDPKQVHLKQLRKDWKAYQRWYWTTPKKQKKQKIEPDRVVESNFSIGPIAIEDDTPLPPPPTDTLVEINATTLGSSTTYNWSNSTVSNSIDLSSGFGTFQATITSSNGNATSSAPQATVTLAPWNPRVPYLKLLHSAPRLKAYDLYLTLKKKYRTQPSFFIDVAEFFAAKGDTKTAVRVLTNLAEMELKDVSLLRVVAQKLLVFKSERLALVLLKDVLNLRPEEPQSLRDYALALAQMGQYNKAVNYLWKLVEQPFDDRFAGIHLIALNEINQLVAQHPKEIDTKAIPSYFIVKLPVDIRVVLNWDADDTDIDLWVSEPDGEKCMYSYQNTRNGGRISNDFTQGYGPEEYLIRKAPKGTYLVQAHYYGNHRPILSGKAILTVQIFQYYGTPYEVRRVITRRLGKVDEEIDLATFEFK